MLDHAVITKAMTPEGGVYGQGVTPNKYASYCEEWQRQHVHTVTREMITKKIISLFEPRFISPPETSALIEALITMTDSRRILEVGMCTGFTSLHILRAIIGKENAKLVSIDARPAHDREFFTRPELAPYFEYAEGWTPAIFEQLAGQVFDLVFLDSDHSEEHSKKELEELHKITRPGSIYLFHDLPLWQCPISKASPPVVHWVNGLVTSGYFRGLILPTCQQADCLLTYGPGYPKEINPRLGVFIRN